MKVNLLYKGLLTRTIYRDPVELRNEDALISLKHQFEINFPRVSHYANDVDIFRFCNGTTRPEYDVFKWKLFQDGKISEMGKLVGIEEVE